MFALVYDTDLRRPGCVLIQAAMGGDTSALSRFFFDTTCWLVAPTPGMKLITGSEEEWKKAALLTEKAMRNR